MAEHGTSEHVSQDFEKIQEQVAQLRSNLRELGQTLLEWGQHGVDDTRKRLQTNAQDLGEALDDTVEVARRQGRKVGEAFSDTVETAQKQGSKVVNAMGNRTEASASPTMFSTISAGVGLLFLLVSGISWAAKRRSR
jgi:uncharacterized phage infection (PIP) family protein YhgE